MATIKSAVDSGLLELVQLPSWETREARRPLYASQDFFDWVDNTPFLIAPENREGNRTPHEHMEQLFSDFRCAERPGGGDLRRVMPTKHGIWKMQPAKLRIYGWFFARKQFVAVCGALEKDTKTNKNLNGLMLQQVRAFARQHGLEQTIIRGDHLAVL